MDIERLVLVGPMVCLVAAGVIMAQKTVRDPETGEERPGPQVNAGRAIIVVASLAIVATLAAAFLNP